MIVEVVCVEVMFIPLIAFDPVAAGAVKLPIRLLKTVTGVPAEMRSPSTVLPALLPFRSETLFSEIVVFAPEEEMAVTAPPPEWLLITLLLIFAVAGAAEFDLAVNAPVPESVPDRMLFVVRLSVPVPPVLTMPDQTPAPEVNAEQF